MQKKYRKKKRTRKNFLQKTTIEHIETLFNETQKINDPNNELSTQYVKIARRIAMKTRTKLPRAYQIQFCKYCYEYLRPGKNARVRIKQKKGSILTITCLKCNKISRYPLKRKKRYRMKKTTP